MNNFKNSLYVRNIQIFKIGKYTTLTKIKQSWKPPHELQSEQTLEQGSALEGH